MQIMKKQGKKMMKIQDNPSQAPRGFSRGPHWLYSLKLREFARTDLHKPPEFLSIMLLS